MLGCQLHHFLEGLAGDLPFALRQTLAGEHEKVVRRQFLELQLAQDDVLEISLRRVRRVWRAIMAKGVGADKGRSARRGLAEAGVWE